MYSLISLYNIYARFNYEYSTIHSILFFFFQIFKYFFLSFSSNIFFCVYWAIFSYILNLKFKFIHFMYFIYTIFPKAFPREYNKEIFYSIIKHRVKIISFHILDEKTIIIKNFFSYFFLFFFILITSYK